MPDPRTTRLTAQLSTYMISIQVPTPSPARFPFQRPSLPIDSPSARQRARAMHTSARSIQPSSCSPLPSPSSVGRAVQSRAQRSDLALRSRVGASAERGLAPLGRDVAGCECLRKSLLAAVHNVRNGYVNALMYTAHRLPAHASFRRRPPCVYQTAIFVNLRSHVLVRVYRRTPSHAQQVVAGLMGAGQICHR